MSKYLLLKHYRGGPEPHRPVPPRGQWAPEDVRYGGPDAAPVTTDGPLPETSDLGAGWYMTDVEPQERAVQVTADAPWVV